MPKDTTSRMLSRQRPVSCKFCRNRKLRCSRDAPCSNCVSRGLACGLVAPLPTPSNDGDAASKSELLDRIQKLEDLVKHVGQTQQLYHQPTPNSETASVHESANQCPLVTAEASYTPPQEGVEPLERDAAWLESIYDNPDRAVSVEPELSHCHTNEVKDR